MKKSHITFHKKCDAKLGTAEAAMLGSVHTEAQAHFRYKLQLQNIQFTIFLSFI